MFKKGDKVILKKGSQYKVQQGTAKFGTLLENEREDRIWVNIRWEKGSDRKIDDYPVKDLLLLKPQKLMDLVF